MEFSQLVTEFQNLQWNDSYYTRCPNAVKQAIFRLYKKTFNRSFSRTCSSCYIDAFQEIYKITQNSTKYIEIMECDYDLLPGALLSEPFGDYSKNITCKNITNGLAEWHLKRSPANIKFFSKFPDDWERRIKLYSEPQFDEEPKGKEVVKPVKNSTPKIQKPKAKKSKKVNKPKKTV